MGCPPVCGDNPRALASGLSYVQVDKHGITILRKTIEGYLDSIPSLTFNTIKTLLNMHAFHSSRHLQSKWMLYFSHA